MIIQLTLITLDNLFAYLMVSIKSQSYVNLGYRPIPKFVKTYLFA